jgi:hypothetical protein
MLTRSNPTASPQQDILAPMIASIHLFKAHTPQPIPPVDDDDDDDEKRTPGSGGGNIDPDDDEGGSDDDDDDDEDETQWTQALSTPPTCAVIEQ